MKSDIHGSNLRGETEKRRLTGDLARTISRWTIGKNRTETGIPSLTFSRWEHPTDPTSYTLEASLCLIAQGSKRVMLGEDTYVYDQDHYLITSVDLPIVAHILTASKERPYLGVIMKIDLSVMSQLMVDGNLPSPAKRHASRGIAVSEVSLPLLDAVKRLVDLIDEPDNIPTLAPLVQREIFYRLLVGDQGPRLRQIVMAGSQGHHVAKAIDWLRSNFAESINVEDLAAQVNMSSSVFYRYFRLMTALSPLQFQKHLRLQEARRLMVVELLDATSAAVQVGYESPSQFSREYTRLFGVTPARDARGLRQLEATGNPSEVLVG